MDARRVREDFPLYSSEEKDTIYLDSACQTLRPRHVIEAMDEYYYQYPACGGRSVHRLATQVSIKIDDAREKIAKFLGASRPEEIIFTKNCTEALNLVAKGLPLKRNDVVITTDIEHNSNHVPWIQVQKEKGIGRRFVVTPKSGLFDLEEFKRKISSDVKVVSIVHINNVTGTTSPIEEIAEIAHDKGAIVVVDGAQAAPHQEINLEILGADFYAISMHKMLGPSGMGVLYGKMELLKDLEPLVSGGGGVRLTDFDHAELLSPPDRFEAGLANYAGIIGSGAAVDYLTNIGMDEVREHDLALNERATSIMKDIEGLSIIHPLEARHRSSILPFNIKGMSSHDVAMIVDEIGKIMIRSGMHCVHPFFTSRKIDGCARASFYIYNTLEECDRFAEVVGEVASKFSM